MKDCWEDWIIGRKWIKRDNEGKFLKGNFHTSNKHREAVSNNQMGHIVSEETKRKISNTLKGLKFSNKRKENISRGTKLGMRKKGYYPHRNRFMK